MANSGTFIRSLIPFKDQGGYISAKIQATQILEAASALIGKGRAGVQITYSANFEQTVKCIDTYKKGGWNTHTSGSNQAAAIAAMETLLGADYQDLQGKMQIAPITTMTYIRTSDIDTTGFFNQTHLDVINQDLGRIKTALDNGWDVLGWVNQDTNPEYAVGGGVANGGDPDHPGEIRFPAHLQKHVRNALSEFEDSYSV